jgi:hypothetical protein
MPTTTAPITVRTAKRTGIIRSLLGGPASAGLVACILVAVAEEAMSAR